MMYDDIGNIKTLEDLLSTSTSTNMVRLKVTLLSFTKTPTEYKVIGLLCEGYRQPDVVEALKLTRARVNIVLQEYRKRLTAEQIEDVYSILKED